MQREIIGDLAQFLMKMCRQIGGACPLSTIKKCPLDSSCVNVSEKDWKQLLESNLTAEQKEHDEIIKEKQSEIDQLKDLIRRGDDDFIFVNKRCNELTEKVSKLQRHLTACQKKLLKQKKAEMEKEMESCPECKCFSSYIFESSDFYKVICSGCGVSGPSMPTRQEAIDKWNKISKLCYMGELAERKKGKE